VDSWSDSNGSGYKS